MSCFAVTSRGASATRWLAHVFASNPLVFVAHGSFPLDSIEAGFASEHDKGDDHSVTEGIALKSFYAASSLDEVYASYVRQRPDASAWGGVHSYTLETLEAARLRGAGLHDPLRVANLVRDPLDFIRSHEALVTKSKWHPTLYQHYCSGLFQEALQSFPDLYLVECPRVDQFLSFAVSCFSALEIVQELQHPLTKSIKMEVITSDARALKQLCEELTGLDYQSDQIQDFINAGPVNRHGSDGDPARSTPAQWPSWKVDVFSLMFSARAIEAIQDFGYSMAVPQASAQHDAAPRRSLANSLSILDVSHPLLHEANKRVEPVPELIESSSNFNLVEYAGRFFAFAKSLGAIDIPSDLPRIMISGGSADVFEGTGLDIVRAFISSREGDLSAHSEGDETALQSKSLWRTLRSRVWYRASSGM